MERGKIESRSAKSPAWRIGDLTVMILGKVGKVRTFKISPPFTVISCLFFVIYMGASVFFINGYLRLRYDHAVQSREIGLLEKTLFEEKEDLHRAKQHLALLEDYIERLQKQEENGTSQAAVEGPETNTEENGLQRSSGAGKGEERPNQIVDIKDLVIQRHDQRISVKFKLVNLQPVGTAVGGYVHVIARKGTSDPPEEWAYPRETIRNGAPENYRRGKLFLIQRFKAISGQFRLARGAEHPSAIKIMIYDESGVLIWDREFQVSDES